jgi:hypothetical protein
MYKGLRERERERERERDRQTDRQTERESTPEDIIFTRAETNTKNQYSNIRDYYSIRIRIFVDVI